MTFIASAGGQRSRTNRKHRSGGAVMARRRLGIRGVACAMGAWVLTLSAAACSDDDERSSAVPTTATSSPSVATTIATTVVDGTDLAWAPCGDGGFECATLPVPRDWSEPEGETIELALIRLPVPDAEGTVVVNWGGPGSSGLRRIRSNGELVTESTGGTMTVVSWDPRGINESTPISCPEGNDAYFFSDPSSPEGLTAMMDAAEERTAACRQRYGDYLALLGTSQVAHDLDAIRAALGEEKLNFLGHSYGTRIGSVYAAMFPDRVGRMILDGSLDPLSTLQSTAAGDAAAFEAALNEWFERCAASPPCAFGEDPAAGFDALVAELRSNPPMVPGTQERLTVGMFNQVLIEGMINFNGSTELAARAIAAFRTTGDPTELYQAAQGAAGRQPDGTVSNSAEIFQFVNSVDWYDRPSRQEVVDEVRRASEAHPRMGAFGVALSYLNNTACPFPARGAPVPTSPDLPPIMVVAGVTDAETPMVWGQRLSAQLPHSFLLVSQAFGHTAYYTSPCVAQLGGRFLRSGTMPAPGTVCPPP